MDFADAIPRLPRRRATRIGSFIYFRFDLSIEAIGNMAFNILGIHL
tara:strand:- start:6797 stop:6934 length:138 start_codon:yes stop_codon:yes gene_type:complete